jgi:predicted SprT family Zn-dependent metalloprotease
MNPVEQVRAKCIEVVAKAKELYGLDLSGVRVSFDLRGRAAGRASGRGYGQPGSAYLVKFNRDMLGREAFDHVLNETVPHEYAHVVCFMNPMLGKNHDYGWARVCRALGGSGATRHKEEVVYGKGRTFEYTTDRGHKVRLSDKRHAYVQQGGVLVYKHGKGKVTKLCVFELVGVRGHTLAQPVAQKPVNHPDAVEMARRQAMVEELRARQRIVSPTAAPVQPLQRPMPTGASKADVARAIMLSGYQRKLPSHVIIAAIAVANGHTKAMATGYYKGNAARVGIPADYV